MLFKTIDELRKYVAISLASDFSVISPFIAYCELRYIIPLIGKEQYDELNEAYNAEEPELSDEQTALLEKLQAALANLSYLESYDELQLQISDNGIRIISDGTYKQAFQWQITNLKSSNIRRGFAYMDEVLAYLEANKDTFTLWADSDAYTQSKQFLINTTDDFNSYVNISASRKTFMALWPLMKKVELFFIVTRIGKDLYDEIKAEILEDNVSDDNKILLDYLKPAIAHFTVARAVIELPMEITSTGFFIDSIKAGSDSYLERTPGDVKLLSEKKSLLEQDAEGYMRQLITYLDANASEDKYAAYFDSTYYTAPADSSTTEFHECNI